VLAFAFIYRYNLHLYKVDLAQKSNLDQASFQDCEQKHEKAQDRGREDKQFDEKKDDARRLK